MDNTTEPNNVSDIVSCNNIIEHNVSLSIINTDLMTDYQELKTKVYNEWIIEFAKIELVLNPDPAAVQKVTDTYNKYINIPEPKLYPLYYDICCYLDKTNMFDKTTETCIAVTKDPYTPDIPDIIDVPTGESIATTFNNFMSDTKDFFTQEVKLTDSTNSPIQSLKAWEITLIVVAILIVLGLTIGLIVYLSLKNNNYDNYDNYYNYSFGLRPRRRRRF